ncbi:hypothetical protein GS880_01955 [Rhodococcus hoagii]|nr:hypothetical protein [Prescottella equi]
MADTDPAPAQNCALDGAARLNAQETAALLGVDERVIRRWEQGKPIPEGVVAELAQLEQVQDDVIRELEDTGKDSGVITTYKGDGVVPDRPELPARWHRVAAAPRSATSQPTESTPEHLRRKQTFLLVGILCRRRRDADDYVGAAATGGAFDDATEWSGCAALKTSRAKLVVALSRHTSRPSEADRGPEASTHAPGTTACSPLRSAHALHRLSHPQLRCAPP